MQEIKSQRILFVPGKWFLSLSPMLPASSVTFGGQEVRRGSAVSLCPTPCAPRVTFLHTDDFSRDHTCHIATGDFRACFSPEEKRQPPSPFALGRFFACFPPSISHRSQTVQQAHSFCLKKKCSCQKLSRRDTQDRHSAPSIEYPLQFECANLMVHFAPSRSYCQKHVQRELFAQVRALLLQSLVLLCLFKIKL